MIYTLTLNPAIDYDVYCDDFEEDKLNLSKMVNFRAGGKGINVSKMLSNLNVQSTALGYLAGFSGDFIEDDLANQKIKTDFININGKTRINIKLNNNNLETEIAGISPEVTSDNIEKLKSKIKLLTEEDTLILSGSIPESLGDDFYCQLSTMVNKNVKIVLDTRGNILEKNLYKNYLIKPNIIELEEMFNTKLSTINEIVEKCKIFLNRGVENIIISRGKDGAIFINKNVVYSAKSPSGKMINTVGAGDSMVAGFMAGIECERSLEDSFKLAIASGTATAYSYELGDKKLIDKLLNEVILKKEEIILIN